MERVGTERRALVTLALRFAPERLLAWLDRRRVPLGEHLATPLGEHLATVAWREGTRRWKQGRGVHDQFIPF